MLNFFVLLSFWYGVISLQTARMVWRERATLADDRVTPRDRALLDRAAFFLLIPLGVLLHEVGHAVATWQVGGTVAQFRWFLFVGWVVPVGRFTPLEDWWISLSGNLVGVLVGLVALGALMLRPARPLAYLTASFARLQLFYALAFYPAFSLLTDFGDWATIYDFGQGGVWARATAATHAALLVGLVALLRTPRFRAWLVSLYAPPEVAEMARAASIVASDPEAAAALNQLGAFYAEQGETALAERTFLKAAERDPTDARPMLNQALMAAARGRHDQALELFGQALERASEPTLKAVALRGMAEAELGHFRAPQALEHAEAAVALDPADPASRMLRGVVRRTMGDVDGAREDLLAAANGPDPGVAAEASAALAALD